MKLYYCKTPTGIKIYSLNKVITKQKNGVDIKILDVASYEDLCILREQLIDAKKAVIWCLNHADETGFKIAMDFVNRWSF